MSRDDATPPGKTPCPAHTPLSVCVLTFNSQRLLNECLTPLRELADEFVVVDSGSTDRTLEILESFGIVPVYRPYTTHGDQMNFAIGQASNDWVLCMDSDEILDPVTVCEIDRLKREELDESVAYRLSRHWHVLGREVHAIYPVSSPDYPVRLFNRRRVRFNDAPVDDKPEGFSSTRIIDGHVRHDTFHSLDEVFNKLNVYTSRLTKYRRVSPSLARALVSAMGAFVKWYFVKQAWRDGRTGVVTGVYAAGYSFLKYFKAWYAEKEAAGRKQGA